MAGFEVPSGEVAKVSIIDTTTRMSDMPIADSSEPPVEGWDLVIDAPSWAFLIESPSGKKALFDLGLPKDYMEMAPSITDFIKGSGWKISVQKEVIDILQEQGIQGSDINSIIWR